MLADVAVVAAVAAEDAVVANIRWEALDAAKKRDGDRR